MASAPSLHLLWRRHCFRPRAKGGIPGPCLPKWKLYPPKRGLCPTESYRLGAMECSSRLETPKILIITPEFVSKNRSFADSAVKTFFCFFGLHSRIRGNKLFVPPQKIIYASPVTLLWRQTFKFLSLFVALVGMIDADVARSEFRWSRPLLKPDLYKKNLKRIKFIAIAGARSISCPDLTAKYSVKMEMWDVVEINIFFKIILFCKCRRISLKFVIFLF